MRLDPGRFATVAACYLWGESMFLRAAAIFAGLVIGAAGAASPASAQFFPPPPPPPPPPRWMVPPADIDVEPVPNYAAPPIYVQPLPPPGQEPAYGAPPQYGRAYPAEREPYPPPVYRA